MRAVLCCLLALTLRGAPVLVDQLTADFQALGAVPRLPNGPEVFDPRALSSTDHRELKALVKAEAPELSAAMDRLAQHISEEYGKPLLPWDLVFTLSSGLAGRTVGYPEAHRLATAVLATVDHALDTRRRNGILHDYPPFRDAVNDAFLTLLDLGLTRRGASVVARQLILAGDEIARRSLFRPTTAAPADLIDRLTADLAALAAIQPLPDPVDLRHTTVHEYVELQRTVRDQHPDLQAAIDRFTQQIKAEYRANVIQWKFAFTLTNNLAGKPIPTATARRLAVTIVGALDNTARCQQQSTDLHACLEFRDPVNNAFLALLDLGVPRDEASSIARYLIEAATQLVRKPAIRPLS